MKVAYLVTSLACKGPIIVIQDIINNLPRDWYVKVYYFDDIVEVTFPSWIKTERIGFFNPGNIFDDFDIVHSHLLRPDLYCWLYGRKSKASIMTTLHSDYRTDLKLSHGRLIGGVVSSIWSYAIKSFDLSVMLTKRQHLKYKEFEKVTVINNGRPELKVDENATIKSIKKKTDGLILLGACAYIVKRKSFDTVIRFLNTEDGKKFAFCLVGDGPEKESLQELVIQLDLNDRVFFIDKTPSVLSYVVGFDIFIMCSSSEGMPLSIIESASVKTPVISTRLPVIEEVFTEEEISFFDFDDLYSLSTALDKLIDNVEVYRRNIYEKYVNNYTDKIMASRYVSCYLNLLK